MEPVRKRIHYRNPWSHMVLIWARFAMYLAFAALALRLVLAINEFAPVVKGELTDINRTTRIVAGTAGELEKSSREWRAASQQSEEISKQSVLVLKNLATATVSLNASAASLNALIAHTDDSLNVVLLPQLANVVSKNDDGLTRLIADTDKTVLALGATSAQATVAMTQATQTLAYAGKILGDPTNQQTLVNVQKITANTAETTAHLDAATADIQQKIHQMTRPASWAKTVGMTILSGGSDVANMVKGF